MKCQFFNFKKIALMCSFLMVLLLTGCVTPLKNGRHNGPPSGVVEIDQNTDPRFFIHNQPGVIGYLRTAGNDVRLNGRRGVRDTNIQNGAHVSTGLASAAIVEFFPSIDRHCKLEVSAFKHGRIYGHADLFSHIVVTDAGVMESSGWPASYHVEAQMAGVTVFTAITGQFSVWLHSDPLKVLVVPSYHQVSLFHNYITPPDGVARDEVELITQWRKNFPFFKKETQTIPNVSDSDAVNDILKEVLKIFKPTGSQDRVDVPKPARDGPKSSDTGTEFKTVPAIILPPSILITVVTVPNLRNKTLADARRILKELGLGLHYGPQHATDQYWVYEQNPIYGQKVEKGTVVNVTVQPPIE
jgi:hypothetical protein